jgi:4-aminobutyrate aminotransferase-like enzyme
MTKAESDADRAKLIARRKKLLGPAYSLFYDKPVHLVKGEGVWLFDADGNKYLDMYNNVPHVGHCHPHVVKALQKQIETLNTHTRYLHDNVLDYAERLTGKLPAELDVAMFSCTGSEANELALRLAREHTGGTGIIVCTYAYHGNTHAIYQISPEDCPEDEIPDFVLSVPAPDAYRGEYREDDAADKYAAHVESAIAEFDKRGVKPAAFVIDTIISSSGVVSPPPGYLRKAAEIIRAAGGLFVADEVQPGFGRTGKNFWGYEADDFVPDIVTMGKPMGNGHPLAATVARTDIVDRFSVKGSYFNTFGGNPVSCAAGLAVLDVLENENLQQNALAVGQYLIDGVTELATRHEGIGEIRGSGLFLAVDMVKDRETRDPSTELASRVVNGLCERGILTGTIGPFDNILKLRPPMVFSTKNADYFLEIVDGVLSDAK